MADETVPDRASPSDLVAEADAARQEANENAREALRYFMAEDGLVRRPAAVEALMDHLDVEVERGVAALGSLVGDIVDPVQQVPHPDGRYVGIIEYREFEDEGAYGYVHYSDRFGPRKRVVCARCVEQSALDENVSHATQGEGTAPQDAGWDDLLNRITAHYADAHEQGPEGVEPGASLVSGTTMGGNQAWHDGNVSAGTNVSISTQTVNFDPTGGVDFGSNNLTGISGLVVPTGTDAWV